MKKKPDYSLSGANEDVCVVEKSGMDGGHGVISRMLLREIRRVMGLMLFSDEVV